MQTPIPIAAILFMAVTGCQTEQAGPPAERGEQRPGRTMLADAELGQHVRQLFAAEPMLAGTAIRVMAGDGVLRLGGMVRTPAQHARVREIVQGIDGVRRVDDYLVRYGRSGVGDGPTALARLQL